MKHIRLVVIILMLTVGFMVFMPLIPQFFVYDENLKETIFIGEVTSGDTFSVSYIHSVNKSKVSDYFEITKDFNIMVTKTSFFSYGAGIPEPKPNTDQFIKVYNDRIDLENINRILDPYKFFVGVTANHTLTMNDGSLITTSGEIIPEKKPMPLRDYVPPQTSVTISIRKISPMTFLLNKF